ncbi:MAG: proton-conducting transporter membrane subunit [Gammaproteobacteria bacterium]
MSVALAMQLAILVPLLGAVLIVLTGKRPNLREGVTLVTAATLFALVLRVAFSDAALVEVTLIEMLPGLTLALHNETLSILFAAVASGLWIVTSIYAIGYMRGNKEKHQTRFYACFAIALAGAVGVAFAANMFTLFIFYEVLTLSTYPLVAHKEDANAKRGARVYLGILLATSIGFLLPAMIGTWWYAGTLDFVPGGVMAGVDPAVGAVLLLLFMYGIGKAALMPFHRWLPSAMVAPTPVSALLHAVAVVKAGVFTVLKVSIYLFGIDYLRELWTSELVMYIAVFTLLAASLVALRQDNLKARLAYSTVSQLSYIVVAAMLVSQAAAIGGAMHIVMHAFGKITLFFCAGAIYVATKKTEISQMDGLGRRMPVTFAAFFLGALSVIGVPPLGGMWSKWFLFTGAFESGYGLVVAALVVSTLLNIAYLVPPVVRAFLLPPPAGEETPGVREAPLMMVVPLAFTALACLAMFFLADPLSQRLASLFTG